MNWVQGGECWAPVEGQWRRAKIVEMFGAVAKINTVTAKGQPLLNRPTMTKHLRMLTPMPPDEEAAKGL